MRRTVRAGFTLIEAGFVAAVGAALLGVIAPAGLQINTSRRGMTSSAKLGQIGLGAAMYGIDHDGRIPGYSWRGADPDGGGGYFVMPDGNTRYAANDTQAANLQCVEILMRRTGRIDGPHKLHHSPQVNIPRHMSHTVLQDYMNVPFPSELFADPADAKQLQWQANPLDISYQNDIPYAPGSEWTDDHHEHNGYTTVSTRQKWAYKSSYHTVPMAYAPDSMPTVRPYFFSTYTFILASDTPLTSGRWFDEVVFPSGKVHMYEEFDRERSLHVGGRWYGYPTSVPDKLMFDGSIDSQASWRANPAFEPVYLPKYNGLWVQEYRPLHQFPPTPLGLGDNNYYDTKWQWTLGGLRGLDYPSRLAPAGY